MSVPTIPITTIDATGASAPDYPTILAAELAADQSIYGSDIETDSSTQDQQRRAIRARAIYDTCQMAVAVFNAFSPASAQGSGLSSVVKINGIRRESPSNSTCQVQCIGVAGTVITAGKIIDPNGYVWDLPATVTIPPAGTITVTATCETQGAISLPAGILSATSIYTPTAGWQSVANAAASSAGDPVEDDATLRQRQTISTSLSAQTPLQAIAAAVANIAGVGRSKVYENDTKITDPDTGIDPNSICAVVEGGDVNVIAQTIEAKKSPGTGTYGSTAIQVTDPAGLPITIRFDQLQDVPIYAAITIKALTGYVATTGTALIQALATFIGALAIGEDVYLNWLYGPAGLSGNPLSSTFTIVSLTIGTSAGALSTSDIVIAFNEAAGCAPADITLTVT